MMRPVERVLPIQKLEPAKLIDNKKPISQKETDKSKGLAKCLELLPREETLRLRLKHVG